MANFYAKYPVAGGAGANAITELVGDVAAIGPGVATATIQPLVVTTGKIADLNVTTGKIADLAVTNAKIANATIDLTTKVTGVLPVANGGTNSSTSLNNNRVIQSSGGKIVESAAITASRALASDANGIPVASATTATELGYVSGVTSSIQTQLDAKQPTGSYITALTGDVTASGPGSAAASLTATSNATLTDLSALTTAAALATVGTVTVGTWNATKIDIGHGGTNSVTALNNNRVMQSSGGAIVEAAAITASRALASDSNGIPVASATTSVELGYVSGVTSSIQTQLNSKQATGNYITALTGDVTAAGPGSSAATLAATSNATLTTLSALTTASSLASVGTITSGTWSGTTIALNKGGTGQTTAAAAFDALSPMSASGDIIYGGASGTGTRLPKGSDGQFLKLVSGVPSWAAAGGGTTYDIASQLSGSNSWSTGHATAILFSGPGSLYVMCFTFSGTNSGTASGVGTVAINGITFLTGASQAFGGTCNVGPFIAAMQAGGGSNSFFLATASGAPTNWRGSGVLTLDGIPSWA